MKYDFKSFKRFALTQIQQFRRNPKTYLKSTVLRRRKITWRSFLRGLVVMTGVGIVMGILTFAWYFKDLPRSGELRSRSSSESTILYDRNGKQIYDISGDERRILVKADEIPDTIKKATIAIEDHNFYEHHGLDFRGLVRGVILKPITGQGFQGGSTITQQYIKNAILSPKRTITRKIKEVILALEIEAIYSKNDILTLYLNEIPYGSNIYGVEAASQAYFGKSAKEGLTISEAATLAAMPQAPTRYSPYGNNLGLLIARKNKVLDAMVKYGSITQEEADRAKKEAPLVAKDFKQKRDNFPAPHFVMYVREQLVQKYGEQLVQRGGLRVTTTLDLDLQAKADDAVKEQAVKSLARVKASNASLVSIDPKNGQVLAMVGSVDYFDREHEGNFNVATAERQPGSAIKPVVYATLFKNKWGPASTLWDVKTSFNGYEPDNFDGKFHGPMTIRKALGNSFNIPAVKALQLAGINDFLGTAQDLGITTLAKKKDAFLSLALGAGEVKLIDLVGAYSVFANNGERHPVSSILKIQDSRSKVLYEWKAEPKIVLKPEIAYEINSILSDNDAKRPTFDRLLGILTVSGKTTALKTGTSNNFKDAWTVGYSPTLVTGVWAGNNDGTEMDHGGGSTAAAPIWHSFMVQALKDHPNTPFPRPESVVDHTVDLLSGKNPTPASGQLVKDIFAPWQLPNKDDDVHLSVKVCKSNGLLATDSTPSDEVEDKVFTRVHSERPDDSNWESPVQAWARDQGFATDVPNQKCEITFRDPDIKITSPAKGEIITGLFSVATEVIIPANMTATVDFTIDGQFHSSDSVEPFTATLDTTNLSKGNHDISAIIHTSNGSSDTDTVSVNVDVDTTAPNEVSNVSMAPGATSGSASAAWTNPSDADLDSVTFYVSQVPSVRGAKFGSVPASPGTIQTSSLSGLTSGVVNYVTIVTTDKVGNSNSPSRQYTVTPI